MASSSGAGGARLGHSEDTLAKIDAVLARILRVDKAALVKAFNEGRLLDFAGEELKKEGIDPKKISLTELTQRMRGLLGQPGATSGASSSSSSSRAAPPPNDLIEQVSAAVDEQLFEPMWQQSATPFDKQIVSGITDMATFRRIDRLLRTTKVLAFVASPLFLFSALRNVAVARPVMAATYGLLAVDCFRVSFNCYIKTYCALALQKLGADGDPAKIASTVMAWASAAMGIGGTRTEDPFKRLQDKVMWEVVLHDLISMRVYRAARELLSENNRRR